MRAVPLALALTGLLAGQGLARPVMFQFSGYMLETVEECQKILLEACEREFGVCDAKADGATLIVDFAKGRHNFSMQCTYFARIDAVVYSVAGSAEVGHSAGLRDMLVRIRAFIDQRR